MSFTLVFSPTFKKSYHKLLKKNPLLKGRISKTLKQLRKNPYLPGLKTHKVLTQQYGEKRSTWVTGSYRIIWQYGEDQQLVILLLDIDDHSVYK